MTPGARVQAAIEVLDQVRSGSAAEQALANWARRSRFAGSKDRAAVRDHVFQALRCWRSYACLGGAETGRGVMIGAMRSAGIDPGEVFNGLGYAPAPLAEAEEMAGTAPGCDGERWDLPDWMVGIFRTDLNDQAEQTALALRERAPVVLRVNLRKASVETALEDLSRDAIKAAPHAISRTALLVSEGARRIAGSSAYQGGLVELQDGSSQAAMDLLQLPTGGRVLDYCAGGGGKVLALAARAEAQWFAHDALPQRLSDLPKRATRAGVEVTVIDTPIKSQIAFDLVLCDVPCSGSGTWRRTPEAKWRLDIDRLQALNQTQDQILDMAAAHVAPGGLLAYATCSVFRCENEDRIEAFLARSQGWISERQVRWPVCAAGDGFFLTQIRRK